MTVYPYPRDYPKKIIVPGAARWVIPGWYPGDFQETAPTPDRLYMIPIFVCEPTTYIRIGINVTAAAAGGSVARLGILGWGLNTPGAVILDAGTVPVDAIDTPEIVIAQTLSRGYFFLAYVGNGVPDLRAPLGVQSVPPVEGMSTTCTLAAENVVLYTDGQGAAIAGGLPDPAPAADAAIVPQWGAYVMLRET